MSYRKPTRYTGMPQGTPKRYATAAIILGGGAILGSSALSSLTAKETNYGLPFTYNGQQYYMPNDSRRALYPSKEACMQDVPWDKQSECEPVSNYQSGGSGGRWYGPVYSPRDASTYRPDPSYPTEQAGSNNVGKRLPSSSSPHGFGANGKAFSGSTGS